MKINIDNLNKLINSIRNSDLEENHKNYLAWFKCNLNIFLKEGFDKDTSDTIREDILHLLDLLKIETKEDIINE